MLLFFSVYNKTMRQTCAAKEQGLGEGGLYFTYGFYSLYIIYIYLFEPIVFYIEFLFPFDEGFMYSNVTQQEYFCLLLSIC